MARMLYMSVVAKFPGARRAFLAPENSFPVCPAYMSADWTSGAQPDKQHRLRRHGERQARASCLWPPLPLSSSLGDGFVRMECGLQNDSSPSVIHSVIHWLVLVEATLTPLTVCMAEKGRKTTTGWN